MDEPAPYKKKGDTFFAREDKGVIYIDSSGILTCLKPDITREDMKNVLNMMNLLGDSKQSIKVKIRLGRDTMTFEHPTMGESTFQLDDFEDTTRHPFKNPNIELKENHYGFGRKFLAQKNKVRLFTLMSPDVLLVGLNPLLTRKAGKKTLAILGMDTKDRITIKKGFYLSFVNSKIGCSVIYLKGRNRGVFRYITPEKYNPLYKNMRVSR